MAELDERNHFELLAVFFIFVPHLHASLHNIDEISLVLPFDKLYATKRSICYLGHCLDDFGPLGEIYKNGDN